MKYKSNSKKQAPADRKIRLLRKELEKLNTENNALKQENAQLQIKINELSNPYNPDTKDKLREYEAELSSQIEAVKKQRELYSALIEKQKKFISKEKDKYRKATNKAIEDFKKSLS